MHRIEQSLAEQSDVEHVSPVTFFFRQQKIEQQGCYASMIEPLRDLNVAWAEAARPTPMRENNEGSRIGRILKGAS